MVLSWVCNKWIEKWINGERERECINETYQEPLIIKQAQSIKFMKDEEV